jgi:hypothetical protein
MAASSSIDMGSSSRERQGTGSGSQDPAYPGRPAWRCRNRSMAALVTSVVRAVWGSWSSVGYPADHRSRLSSSTASASERAPSIR